ncbi:hypothetical protein [Phyllobacterium lublinensis]|uniref:hypothetical protein n=1 Tax=Phyllobacterium lublinensis TaxID=2875708 RepID=UPI001CCAC5A5|nr:hypothetical protein [Phyllobacterium sp. 2063]MBZ9654558.1 hypothetical protein [Phyllobacterium sp. 2063]
MEVDVNVDVPETESVTEQEARTELDRLLSDPQFHSTERNRNFLRFVAREMFEGRAAAVKAYTIAVDVFGRPCSFDPTTDPIVRIEATRLRASLAQYYEARAEEGSVRIELPRGRYIPVFTKAPPLGDGVEDAEASDQPDASEHIARGQSGTYRRWVVLAAVVLAATLSGFVWLITDQAPVFSEKPSVAVQMKMAGDATDTEAGLIRDYLMIALSQFQTLKLAAGEQSEVAATAAVTRSVAGLSMFMPASKVARSYQVVLKYHPTPTDRSVWWQIVDPATGEALFSGVERVFIDKASELDVRRELITRLASRFAGVRGVITGMELAHELAAPTFGNGCILRSAIVAERVDAEGLWEARTCLGATLLAMPNDPDINAELAIVQLELDPQDAPTELTSNALALASKAVALAPTSDRAGYAQMLAQFRSGQSEAAFVTGYHAMLLNPNNSLIPARLGAMLFAKGRWAEGVGLAVKAGMIDNTPHSDAGLTLALDAYRRGEFAEALLRVQQMGRPDNYVANILELAASGQTGNAASIAGAMKRLHARDEHFAGSFRTGMEARQYSPSLVDQLSDGLVKAGLTFPEPVAAAAAN